MYNQLLKVCEEKRLIDAGFIADTILAIADGEGMYPSDINWVWLRSCPRGRRGVVSSGGYGEVWGYRKK